MLESADDEPLASTTPAEEATLLDEPKESHMITTCPLRCEEWTPDPDGATGLGEATTESPDSQRCLPLPPGFGLLPSELEPPPLEDEVPLVGISNPEEAQLTLMSVRDMNVIVHRKKCMGHIEY